MDMILYSGLPAHPFNKRHPIMVYALTRFRCRGDKKCNQNEMAA